MKTFTPSIILFFLMTSFSNPIDKNSTFSNEISDDKMLLVLSAPSVHNEYYKSAFQQIVNFQIEYAKKILTNDNVIIIVDSDTKKYYENNLPQDILITGEIHDIWMRDFTTVNPTNTIQFKYTWASMSKKQSIEVQNSFNSLLEPFGINFNKTDLLLDGGNIVDNYNGKVITTTRFLEENHLTYEEGKQKLKKLLEAKEVAIIEPDEETLAHSDGMASWIDENTLLINDYSNEPEFKKSVIDELKISFPNSKIIEVPVEFKSNPPGKWAGFESACGVNLNSTVTYNNIYVPTFGMPHEKQAIDIIKKNTNKNIIEIDAKGVCEMGGSVRCLTWQVTGKTAEILIEAARKH